MAEDWADKAFERFQREADDQRRQEELELLRANQVTFYAVTRWKEFYAAISKNVEKFNRLAQRTFLDLKEVDEGHYHINAPKLSAVVMLSVEPPSINYSYSAKTPAGIEKRGGGRFEFAVADGEVWVFDESRNKITAEEAAVAVLDKLVK